jgi:hypothetical protein
VNSISDENGVKKKSKLVKIGNKHYLTGFNVNLLNGIYVQFFTPGFPNLFHPEKPIDR